MVVSWSRSSTTLRLWSAYQRPGSLNVESSCSCQVRVFVDVSRLEANKLSVGIPAVCPLFALRALDSVELQAITSSYKASGL